MARSSARSVLCAEAESDAWGRGGIRDSRRSPLLHAARRITPIRINMYRKMSPKQVQS